MTRNNDLRMAAERLHHLAEWAAVFGMTLEPRCRCPNDVGNPGSRTVSFDATELDHFLNGLCRLPAELEQIAARLDQEIAASKLGVIAGGRV